MPIFEYRCEGCGKVFEHIQLSASAGAEGLACPKCAGTKVSRKLYSRFAMAGVSKRGDDFGDFGGGDFGGGGDDDFGGGGEGMDASAGCGRCGAPESCSTD